MAQPDPFPLVLMVEDEPLLLASAAESLPAEGFRLIGAIRAGEALQTLRDLAAEVAVAVVDLGLPDMLGDELARRLREIRPTLPIVIASGYSRRRLRNQFAGMAGLAFLEKPYGTPELAAAIRSLLGPSAGPRNGGADASMRGEDADAIARQ